MSKTLIIKLGYSETLDPEIGTLSSLGDVMRTTVILHAFRDSLITWLTDESAYPLLRGNSSIDRILFFNLTSVLQLKAERFDTIINLEKVPGICALADSISAWMRYGFRFDGDLGEAEAYRGSIEALRIYRDIDIKRLGKRAWQDVLYEMIGEKWHGEGYILGYQPRSTPEYDVGLNFQIGRKWPNKAWHKWDKLYTLLTSKDIHVSWQQGEKNIEDYIEWINRCDLIVTHDSLGLHLALALGKKVVALFGPTVSEEVFMYGLGSVIRPSGNFSCLPCLKPDCHLETCCMDTIDVDQVYSEIERRMKDGEAG